MEKYRDYFKEWNADVAFGTNKSNIFYVLAPRNEFEAFLFFQTAEQLERIILGTIAENVEIIMEAGIDEIFIGFSADKMDGEYGNSGKRTEKCVKNFKETGGKRLLII